jgi:chitinase
MLCTHIIYAFAGLDRVTHSIQNHPFPLFHPFLNTEENDGRGNNKFKIFKKCTTFSFKLIFYRNIFVHNAGQYKKVVNLKQKNPKLKVSIAIGGPGEGSWKYSDMADKPENRKKFIESVLDFTK